MRYQLVIDGRRTYDDLGLILSGTPRLSPPEPKTYTVDIPGGDGVVDLTEFGGDTSYQDRDMEFDFVSARSDPAAFEKTKTSISELFHGRRLKFSLSWDAGYTYEGRFSVNSYESARYGGNLTIKVDASPYKVLDGSPLTWLVNARGGVRLTLPCGRKRVCPTFQANTATLVSYHGHSWVLNPGASRITELWISSGDNVVTLNSQPSYSVTAWSGITGRWSDHDAIWSVLAAGDKPLQASDAWADHPVTWSAIRSKRWVELMHDAAESDLYAVYVQYEYATL